MVLDFGQNPISCPKCVSAYRTFYCRDMTGISFVLFMMKNATNTRLVIASSRILKLHVSMFCFRMLAEVGCWVYGSGQQKLLAQFTPHTQTRPLIFSQFGVMWIPPSSKVTIGCCCHADWLSLHAIASTASVWNESLRLLCKRAAEAVLLSKLSPGKAT